MRLLYLIHEPWPTYHPDLSALFGKYLLRLGVETTFVTERNKDPDKSNTGRSPQVGPAILCSVPSNPVLHNLVKFWHNIHILLKCSPDNYDAIQVRDMPVTGLAALVAARLKGLPYFYWMSYPQSEGQLFRAKARGPAAGLQYWYPLLQGTLGKWLLYKFVLPRADHVFVQSRKMAEDVAVHSVALQQMTPVPMGVDLDLARPEEIQPIQDERLTGKRVVAYLGTLDPARHIDVLFQMAALVRREIPDLKLVLIGDTHQAKHRAWLKAEARRIGVDDVVLWTSWLPMSEAWRYVRAAEVGLSPIPRSFLLDAASPTKAVEYMALGLPVLANDNPDQEQAITESGAGICVPLTPQDFAGALLGLLRDPVLRREMGERGRRYVASVRSYDRLAEAVFYSYRQLLKPA